MCPAHTDHDGRYVREVRKALLQSDSETAQRLAQQAVDLNLHTEEVIECLVGWHDQIHLHHAD